MFLIIVSFLPFTIKQCVTHYVLKFHSSHFLRVQGTRTLGTDLIPKQKNIYDIIEIIKFHSYGEKQMFCFLILKHDGWHSNNSLKTKYYFFAKFISFWGCFQLHFVGI